MASSIVSSEKNAVSQAKQKHLIGGLRFDTLMIILSSWFIGGIYIDGWAHAHGKVDGTFFTPWHALLYSGYAACAAILVAIVALNHQRGYSWRESIPDGYGLSLLGVPVFAAAGVGDLFWHILFGFEVGIEPLLSPTHLLLAFGGIVIMSGAFRAVWRRSDTGTTHGWATLYPMIVSVIATYSLFTFFTEFAHPFVHTFLVTSATGELEKAAGAASILLQAGLLMGFVLLMVKRWQLPFGTLTLIFTANIALVSLFDDQYRLIPVAIIAGLVADLLIRFTRPSTERPQALRIFAFIVPVVLYLGYFIDLMITNGSITWSIHLWLGSSIMTGIVGLLLSYLLVPPQGPAGKQA